MRSAATRRAILLVLLTLAVTPYVIGLDDSAIWDANEAFYVQTPREMLARHTLVDPTFNSQPRFNKPPLSYWIVAAFYKSFGESVAVERLAIACGAMLLVAAAFGLGKAAFSTDAGLVAALAVASAPRVVMYARRIVIDVWVTAFLGLVLLAFALAECRAGRRSRYLALMYVAIGLGFMVKGPIAVALPGLVVLGHLALHGRLRDLGRLELLRGVAIVAAIVAPWYATVYAEHGWAYIRTFFVDENLARYVAPYGDKVAERGVWFYVPVLFTELFPWSLFGVASLGLFGWRAWRDRRSLSTHDSGSRSLPALFALWVVVIVGFFSLSQTKQDLYIFPATAALAALAGGLVVRGLCGEPPWTGWLLALTGVTSTLVAAVGVAVLYLFSSPARVYAIGGAAPIAWVAMSGGVASGVLAVRRRLFAAVAMLGLAAVAINWIFVLQALPSFRRYQPVPAMAERIRERAGPDARVGYYRVALPSLVYYAGRPVFEAFAPGELATIVSSGETYCLVRATDYAELREALPVATCIVAREPVFDVKIGNVLALRPLPELLLVTNKCPSGS